MYVKNWMLPAQFSISSDALATDALLLIREHNLKILPVVDNGRLRGVLHRRDLSEAALCVSGSGDLCEIEGTSVTSSKSRTLWSECLSPFQSMTQ